VTPPDLSVVLAAGGPLPRLKASVAALDRSCRGVAAELIVVSDADPSLPAPAAGGFSPVRMEHCPPRTLTPVLWGAGLRLSHGRVIAFTTDQLLVGPSWARSLLDTIGSGALGAGGPIELAPDADGATCAAYLARFSAFIPSVWPTAGGSRDIPGDNAAYRGDALRQHADLVEAGFWEVEFHRRFERDGGVLRMEPAAVATLAVPIPLGDMVRQRYHHAREFGAERVRRHGASRLKLLAAAPLVPLVMLARIGRRTRGSAAARRIFWKALPRLGLLAAAWAAGEAAGALR
jgi:hypothetical protein